ncbi:hypothetical protein [Amycolatopsis anabasis]|uniref:hypothetical protein n=1 Tax=Amycolatopsis anabasis TaxID=1840409 RepID=UPI00131A6823|nr:hypothetical protein [Amycolatopsis anabasis]
MLAHALGVAGIVLNLTFIWPQVWRARRSVVGISLGTVLAGYSARLLWSIYAVRADDVELFLGQAPIALGFLIVAGFVYRGEPTARRTVPLGVAAVTLVVAALTPWHTILSVVAVIAAAVVNLPQMIRVIREPGRVAGVSPAMYWLVASASAVWLTYGFLVHDLTISAPHFVLFPTGLVTAFVVQRHRKSPVRTPSADSGLRHPGDS